MAVTHGARNLYPSRRATTKCLLPASGRARLRLRQDEQGVSLSGPIPAPIRRDRDQHTGGVEAGGTLQSHRSSRRQLAFGRVAAAVVAVMYWVDNPIWLAGTLSITAMAAFSTFFVNLSLSWEYVFGLLFIWVGIASVIMALKFGKWVATIGAGIRILLITFFTLTVLIYAGQHGPARFSAPGRSSPPGLSSLAAAPILIFKPRRLRVAVVRIPAVYSPTFPPGIRYVHDDPGPRVPAAGCRRSPGCGPSTTDTSGGGGDQPDHMPVPGPAPRPAPRRG